MARDHTGQIIRAGKGAERLGTWLNSNMDQIARALPSGARADRLARIFVTECQRIPGLLACEPASLLGGFLQASQCGLEIGAHLGQAYLVPFKVRQKRGGRWVSVPTATLIIGYKGMVSLAYRSGLVQNVQAMDVREVDFFEEPTLGTEPRIVHRPVRGRESATVVAAYAVVRLRGATVPNLEWMWRDEIDAVKARSRAAASGSSPWQSDYSMMARKTALRRACKYIPQTPETRDLHGAVVVDEQADANLSQTFDLRAEDLSPFPDYEDGEVEVLEEAAPEPDGTLSPEEEERMARELDGRDS